jgi:hypothetical protein
MGTVLLEEMFQAGEPGFLDELRATDLGKKGRAFAERWYADPRPWARLQIHEYINRGLTIRGHEPLVKRLFKAAEFAGDDRTLAHFMVAFDRSVRRVVNTKYLSWNPITTQEYLRSVSGGEWIYSVHTRNYLRRRAWRYFRALGRSDPKRYEQAVALALTFYTDDDVKIGEQLLSRWGLVHALFHHHSALDPKRTGWTLKPDRALSELSPAPAFPDAWTSKTLVALLLNARCRTVRWWAYELITKKGESLPLDVIMAMLDHTEPDVQALGANLFSQAKGLERLPIDTWLKLLEIKSPEALDLVCETMKKSVAPDRLTLDQCIALACAPIGTVAKLGAGWLKGREVRPEQESIVADLAKIKAEVAAEDAVAWARQALAKPSLDTIAAFLDSTNASVRKAAWPWFEEKFVKETALWAKLFESPYDDIRGNLVRVLQTRPSDSPAAELLWASTMLNIHRGGRKKLLVIHQLARAMIAGTHPVEKLLPLVSLALRSVRPPERRAALAAIVSIAQHRPELRQKFPELTWS